MSLRIRIPQTLTKQSYFYYIAFMLMVSIFLPILNNNIRYNILTSNYIWAIIWIISLLVFYPKAFLNKTMFIVLAYGFAIFLAKETFWSNMDDWNYRLLFNEFYDIVISVSVISYFLHRKDYIGLAKLTRWSIVFLFITAVMSIISASINPMYARDLAGLSAATSSRKIKALTGVYRYGGGTYGTAEVFMCLFPIFIYYYKNIKTSLLSKKQIIIFSIIIFLALLSMQIFANILIAILIGSVALLGMKKKKQSILVFGIIFLSIVVINPKESFVSSLMSVGDTFKKDSELNFKFKDFAILINTGKSKGSSAGGKAERYPMLMKTFLKSPLLGCYFISDKYGNGYQNEGGHLYWMNKLTVTGIIGLCFFLFILYKFIKNNLKYFNSTYKFYYILASFAILSYGLMKNIALTEPWYALFIILPGLYYLPLLRKKQ